MEFEWDANKSTLNLRKHGVRFEDAARVFLDPNRIEAFDGREAHGEDRWKTVGLVELLYSRWFTPCARKMAKSFD